LGLSVLSDLVSQGYATFTDSRRSTLGWLRVVPSGLEQKQARSNPFDGGKLNSPDLTPFFLQRNQSLSDTTNCDLSRCLPAKEVAVASGLGREVAGWIVR